MACSQGLSIEDRCRNDKRNREMLHVRRMLGWYNDEQNEGGETRILIPFGLYKQRLGLSQSHNKPQRYELSVMTASRDLFAKV